MQSMNRAAWILLLAAVPQLRSETLHVPSEYVTIQMALDVAQSGDTVLVEPGAYAEQILVDEPVLLKGNVTDSVHLPTIDPSTLINPVSLRCATINSTDVVIQDFGFRNGPAMYPRELWSIGGIECTGSNPTFERCVFDSVHVGIRANSTLIRLEDCRFMDAQNGCVWSISGGIDAENCSFQGRSYGWGFLWFSSATSVRNCSFTDSGNGEVMLASGNGIRVEDCLFCGMTWRTVPFLQVGGSNIIFERNAFQGIETYTTALSLNSICDSVCAIRDNLFSEILPAPQWPDLFGSSLLAIGGDGEDSCSGVLVANNVFADCQARVATLGGDSAFYHNRIHNCRPDTQYCWEAGAGRHLLRDNMWTETPRALWSWGFSSVNAESNWWGDESGPYHQTRHPAGRGSQVEGEEWNLDFDPWYTDTLFWNSASPEPRPQMPSEVTLSVYPNPFNAAATLELFVPKAQIVEVKLYDLLGREVAQLFKGPAIDAKRIAVNGTDLASGIYFARASDPIRRRSLAEVKMLLVK